jgi:hypothetical protein
MGIVCTGVGGHPLGADVPFQLPRGEVKWLVSRRRRVDRHLHRRRHNAAICVLMRVQLDDQPVRLVDGALCTERWLHAREF